VVLYLPIYKTDILNKKIEIKVNSTGYIKMYKTLKDLVKAIKKKHRKLDGWYYKVFSLSDDGLYVDEEAPYIHKNIIPIELPVNVDVSNRIPVPLNAMDRIWKPIPGFSKYLASNLGEILTLKTGNFTKGVSAGHYLKVSIFKDGSTKSKMEYVHILVCTAFHGVGPKGFVVMHKDDNKENCNATNLKWGSQSQNIQDVWDKRKKNMEKVNQLVTLEETLSFESVDEAVNMLSNENGLISNINNFVLNRLNSISELFSGVTETISGISGESNKELRQLRSDISSLKRIIKNKSYASIESRETPVVIGLNTNLIELENKLSKNEHMLGSLIIDSLSELNVILSKIMSDEDYRKSFKPKKTLFEKTEEVAYEIKNNLSGVIDVNSNNDRMPVGKLVPNLTSLPKLAEDTAILGNKLGKVNFSKIDSLVKEIAEKTNMLHEHIVSKDNKFEITKSTLHALSTGLDNNASLISIAMTNYSLINHQIGMVNNLIKIVKM